MNKYIVMCQVSGGVTGFRQGPMKGEGGAVRLFETREQAQAACPPSRVTDRGVCFEYWVEAA